MGLSLLVTTDRRASEKRVHPMFYDNNVCMYVCSMYYVVYSVQKNTIKRQQTTVGRGKILMCSFAEGAREESVVSKQLKQFPSSCERRAAADVCNTM